MNLATLFMLQNSSSNDFGKPMFVGNVYDDGSMNEFVVKRDVLSNALLKSHGLLRGCSETNMLCVVESGS